MTAMSGRDLGRFPDGPAADVLTAAGPHGFRSWAALLVEPVPGRESGEGSQGERRAEAAIADAGWLAGLGDPAGGARLELRYLHRPGEKLRCVLLGRVDTPTAGAATSAARRLRDRLASLPPHVRATSAGSAADIQRLLNPFRPHPSGLAEVRKQIRWARPIRRDAGVAYYLAVPRLATGASSWDPLWQGVADLPQPFLLTVGLEPYAPPPQFGGMLADLAIRYGRLATPGRSAQSSLRQHSYELPADPFAAYAAPLFTEAWRHYQSGVFRARITLASPEPLPEPLVARVAATICAPRGNGETTHVVVTPAPDERDTAWRNVTMLENERWDRGYLAHLPEPPPSGLRLLAETMDASEAASAWRLPPAPSPGGRTVFHISGDHATVVNESVVHGSFNVGGGSAAGAEEAGPKLNILLACANPRGSKDLRLGEEDRTLRESIKLSAGRDRITIETLNAVTVDDLRRALMATRFDVVHFSGHGAPDGRLAFEDAVGNLFEPPTAALAQLFARRGIRVAVLNACYSLSVDSITGIGTEYTIASDGPLADPAAIEFTRGFYDALGHGLEVPDAFEEGRDAAALKGQTFTGILLRAGERHVAST
ncbi:CHAT domain-containing protein [Actinoplanes sp. NPDC051851]|uniref:CHAT domain-containing protein n=1 Tax=Actinoplanes sp. NPDC051851 TaxID=3154753 RepID=UPI003437BCFA